MSEKVKSLGFPRKFRHKIVTLRQELVDAFIECVRFSATFHSSICLHFVIIFFYSQVKVRSVLANLLAAIPAAAEGEAAGERGLSSQIFTPSSSSRHCRCLSVVRERKSGEIKKAETLACRTELARRHLAAFTKKITANL